MGQGPMKVNVVQTATQGKATLGITTATQLKSGAGVLLGLVVTVAGTAAGTANDSAAPSGDAPANVLAAIPSTVGNVALPPGGIPFTSGLVVAPGTGQTVVATFK